MLEDDNERTTTCMTRVRFALEVSSGGPVGLF